MKSYQGFMFKVSKKFSVIYQKLSFLRVENLFRNLNLNFKAALKWERETCRSKLKMKYDT